MHYLVLDLRSRENEGSNWGVVVRTKSKEMILVCNALFCFYVRKLAKKGLRVKGPGVIVCLEDISGNVGRSTAVQVINLSYLIYIDISIWWTFVREDTSFGSVRMSNP